MIEKRVPATIEVIQVGERFGPIEYLLAEKDVAAYMGEGQDGGECLTLPDGRRAAAPTITARDYGRLLTTKYLTDTAAYAKVYQEYKKPVVAPVALTVAGAIVDKYIRRGREYLVLEVDTHDDASDLVAISHHTIWINTAALHDLSEDTPRAETRHEPALAGQAEQLPSLAKIARMTPPPGGHKWGSPHNDEYARQVLGLRAGLVPGNTTMCYVGEMLRLFFGLAWLEKGVMDISFVGGGAVSQDPVTARGEVRRRLPEGATTRLEVDVRLENHATGQPAILGSASCTL